MTAEEEVRLGCDPVKVDQLVVEPQQFAEASAVVGVAHLA